MKRKSRLFFSTSSHRWHWLRPQKYTFFYPTVLLSIWSGNHCNYSLAIAPNCGTTATPLLCFAWAQFPFTVIWYLTLTRNISVEWNEWKWNVNFFDGVDTGKPQECSFQLTPVWCTSVKSFSSLHLLNYFRFGKHGRMMGLPSFISFSAAQLDLGPDSIGKKSSWKPNLKRRHVQTTAFLYYAEFFVVSFWQGVCEDWIRP